MIFHIKDICHPIALGELEFCAALRADSILWTELVMAFRAAITYDRPAITERDILPEDLPAYRAGNGSNRIEDCPTVTAGHLGGKDQVSTDGTFKLGVLLKDDGTTLTFILIWSQVPSANRANNDPGPLPPHGPELGDIVLLLTVWTETGP